MNSVNFIRKNDTVNSAPNLSIYEAALYLLPFIVPIIYMAIDKIANFTHDAMEHGYDIKFKAGPVDIALIKNNL